VEAEIVAFKEEDDGDYHLEIQGDSGQTMVAEVPKSDPLFVNPANRRAKAIAAVRQQVADKLKPTRQFQKTQARAHYWSWLFDKVRGQRGMAPNGIELHPVIGIEFL
jgi:hypothetical protein